MDKQSWQNLVDQKGWWEAYSAYLSSPDWQDKRQQRLIIDQNECRLCGSQDDLEIHHKPSAYKNIPNEDVVNDLTTLCAICHEAITSSIRQRRYNSREIAVQFILPREAESELKSYGMAESELPINGRKPPDYAQWRLSEPAEPDCETAETSVWQTKEDRRRFRGIG